MRDMVQTELSNIPAVHRDHFPQPPKQNDRKSWQEYEQLCTKARGTAAKSKEKITKELKWQSGAATRQRIQKQYPTKQKQMNKQFLGEETDKKQLTYVQNKETGRMLNDPEAVLEYVQSTFQEQAKPSTGSAKTGVFRPNDENRQYPWKHGAYSNIDPFTLETAAGKSGFGNISLLEHVCDPCIFQEKMRHLKNGKAPGPDGIPNELLKHLPGGVHQAIHKLFILMWMTGTTPKAWKESQTVLLHKKGSAHDLGNWRPIALANTLYKLWTSVIAECLYRYAEHFNILSSAQEGFRKQKNTIRQLQNVMNIMSDAKISQQDLYLLYVDFSSAFNTIDHDKLLCIMHDLGFPEDAIEVIAELYTDAITKIKLYFAETGPNKIERGTIQGDTLSPLLFLIFIEPLLRWLQSGGRGYKYGCLSKSLHADHTTSTSAYADDMLAAALTASDLARQAEKIEAFVNWSGMAVNVKKCAVTGILWSQARKNGSDKVLSSKMIKMLQQRLETVRIYNTPIPFLHPHTEPYRYLGVDITPTLNWAPHVDRVLKEAKRKGDRLVMSPLSIKQKAQALDTVIGSCMSYSMPLGLMTLSDISKCDAIKLNICKRIYKLPRSTPSAMIHQDREHAGLGLTSMNVMYAKLTCTYLTKALNDKGPLGFVTRPMLLLQNEIIGESLKQGPSARYVRQTSHYHLARQLTVLQTSGLELTVPARHRDLRGNTLSSTLAKARYDPCYLGPEHRIPPHIYHKLLEVTDDLAELCLPTKQKVILLSTSELALKFGRLITNQHKLALNQLTTSTT